MSKASKVAPPKRSATSLARRIRAVPGWWAVSLGKGSDQRVWAWRWAQPETGTVLVNTWDEFRALRAEVEADCGPAPAGSWPTLSKRLPPSGVDVQLQQLKLPI